MTEILTGWFDGQSKPVRTGVYQVITHITGDDDLAFSYFDGVYWNGGWLTAQTAEKNCGYYDKWGSQGSCEVLFCWRGLAKKP